MLLIGGFIPVSYAPAAEGGTGWLAALVVFLIAVAITAALVYFSRAKAEPIVRHLPDITELPKAA